MHQSLIKVGETYTAEVRRGTLVQVKVEAVEVEDVSYTFKGRPRAYKQTRYSCINLSTGRKILLESKQFRRTTELEKGGENGVEGNK